MNSRSTEADLGSSISMDEVINLSSGITCSSIEGQAVNTNCTISKDSNNFILFILNLLSGFKRVLHDSLGFM